MTDFAVPAANHDELAHLAALLDVLNSRGVQSYSADPQGNVSIVFYPPPASRPVVAVPKAPVVGIHPTTITAGGSPPLPESFRPMCPGKCGHPLWDHGPNGCVHGCEPRRCIPNPPDVKE